MPVLSVSHVKLHILEILFSSRLSVVEFPSGVLQKEVGLAIIFLAIREEQNRPTHSVTRSLDPSGGDLNANRGLEEKISFAR